MLIEQGLLLALELDRTALQARDEPALLTALLATGISTTTKGDDAIGFSPPLTISEPDIESALHRIAEALASLGR